jgi:RNA polymerase sigma-70 factor (ECF subfamily)
MGRAASGSRHGVGVRNAEELVELCRSGDALAWESLIKQTQARVYGLACHYLRSPEEARDLAQDVFVRFHGKLDRFDGTNVLGYLQQMTRNACIDAIRRRKARPPTEDVVVDEALSLESPTDSAETEWIRNSRHRLVHDAIGRLSKLSREIVLLKEIEGLKISEIAALLGVPEGTVKTRSHRARRELVRRVLDIDPSYATEGAEL